jgi:hypothetical protein
LGFNSIGTRVGVNNGLTLPPPRVSGKVVVVVAVVAVAVVVAAVPPAGRDTGKLEDRFPATNTVLVLIPHATSRRKLMRDMVVVLAVLCRWFVSLSILAKSKN